MHAQSNPANEAADANRRNQELPVSLERRGKPKPPPPTKPPAKERTRTIPVAGKDRRIGPVEPPVTEEESSFVTAMNRYKRENRRPFPTWSEVLEVLRSLGYRKVAEENESMAIKSEMPAPKG